MTNRSTGHWGGWCAAVLLTAAACGGGTKSESGGRTETDGVPIDELSGELAEAVCITFANCNDLEPLLDASFGGDCEGYMRILYEDSLVATIRPLVEQGHIIYHGDRAGDCLNLYRTSDCAVLDSGATNVCLEIFEGTVSPGGECSMDEECAGDAFCRLDTACPGVCAALSAVGGFCGFDDHCQSGLVCPYNLHQCVQPGPVGAPCTSGEECQSGLVCSYANEQCVAPQPAGAECDYSDLLCADGFSCESDEADPSAPSTCVAEPADASDVIVGVGEACNTYSGPQCADGLHCVFETDPYGQGVCSDATAAAGASCQAAYPTQCPAGYYCDASPAEDELQGICQAVPEEGEPCADGEVWSPDCPAQMGCVDGICLTMQRVGGACQGDDQCYTDACVDGVCSGDPCANFEPLTSE